jgi:PIN domain nuclease of toxin-antitoxin system
VYLSANPALSPTYRAAIQDANNEVFLSAASVWEATIKYALGKLPLPQPAADYLPSKRQLHQIKSLPIDEGAFRHLAQLPLLHRDPFDRIIVAQSRQHDLTLASVDPIVCTYPVKLLKP